MSFTPSKEFLDDLEIVKNKALEYKDMGMFYLSFHRPDIQCNLMRFNNFDSSNQEIFYKFITLRKKRRWNDELMFSVALDVADKWGVEL